MTNSSSSKPRSGRRRLYREVLRVAFSLLLLEMVVRLPPVKAVLDEALAPYENLLWYSENMPAYQYQLTNGPHYDVWLGGSSYMMTGLQPEWVGAAAHENGVEGLSFQNYGLNTMQNLGDMADVYHQWLFQMDQPEYMILAISFYNFTPGGRLPSRARTSPMEQATIFSDSVDDYAAGWLYHNSALYRYTLLARNATFIPREQATLKAMPLGGFVEANDPFDGCDPTAWLTADAPLASTLFNDFSRLDYFLSVIQERGIPVAIVNIPMQYCALRNSFLSFADYRERYLTPVTDHLQALGIPFLDMDTPFQAQVAPDEQHLYFRDFNHPNGKGAALLSEWTGAFAAEWIRTMTGESP